MKTLGIFLLAISLIFVQTASAATHKSLEISESNAKVLAEKIFLKRYKNTIKTYELAVSGESDDKASWYFGFKGTGQYERPGYHAVVEINKKTRKALIFQGK
jgi:hypothetical protein